MLKRNNFLLGAILAVGMALPAVSGETTANTVVATINGVEITVGHIIATKGTLPEQYQSLPDDVLFDGILEQLIQQTVLSQAMEGDQSKRITLTVENELRSLRAGVVLDAKIANVITDETLQAAYEARFADSTPVKEFNAAHILVKTEDEAKEIRKLLDEGADFAELAKEKSTGPSGASGGSLGWFGPGMMVKPFEDAVMTLKAGQLSDPIKTQFGWHILILKETRLKETPSLESIKAELEAEIQQKAVKDIISDLTNNAKITRAEEGSIPVSILSNTDLIDN
ncbi:MAG TPA: peptidylprolyl isomerase [Rhodobacteraceae bacterium]|jgi:peptidyl-prolyl cis-trans isomerase C|nr:peptidylprolyl isomerase [Paracoccaceae bacterium]